MNPTRHNPRHTRMAQPGQVIEKMVGETGFEPATLCSQSSGPAPAGQNKRLNSNR